MKLSCAVIDDEPLALELIESYVSRTPFLELKGTFESSTCAFDALHANPVDLLFCDIQMPGLNGIDLSRMLPEATRVIFTTAFSNYAIEGFRVNAIDYLLKPISYPDFLTAANKALSWFETTRAAAAAEPEQIKTIFIKTNYNLVQVPLGDILFIEGMKDYVKIHIENQDSIVSQISMKTLQAQLPSANFFRVHKSYIVNIDKIRVIERNRIVYGKYYVPISDNERDAFFAALAKKSLIPE